MNNRSGEHGGNKAPKAPRRPPITAFGALALIAVLVSSDFYAKKFWLGHPVMTAILASLSAVLVSVTVIDVVLNRRSERRWRLLAQYALLELAEAARGAWSVLLGLISEGNSGSDDTADPSRVIEVLDSSARAPMLKRKIDTILTDPLRRDELRESLEQTLAASREVISRWGAVMTGSTSFSELFDRPWAIALRVVPPDWWDTRTDELAAPAHAAKP